MRPVGPGPLLGHRVPNPLRLTGPYAVGDSQYLSDGAAIFAVCSSGVSYTWSLRELREKVGTSLRAGVVRKRLGPCAVRWGHRTTSVPRARISRTNDLAVVSEALG